jgi:hypothetical protein
MLTRRFDDFREITAKFDSTATCGHAAKAGDRIGYAGKRGYRQPEICCADCWSKWCDENREAAAYEQGLAYNG